MRAHGRRHACETPEEREARLQQTSDDRREARLEHEIFDQLCQVKDFKTPFRFGVY